MYFYYHNSINKMSDDNTLTLIHDKFFHEDIGLLQCFSIDTKETIGDENVIYAHVQVTHTYVTQDNKRIYFTNKTPKILGYLTKVGGGCHDVCINYFKNSEGKVIEFYYDWSGIDRFYRLHNDGTPFDHTKISDEEKATLRQIM